MPELKQEFIDILVEKKEAGASFSELRKYAEDEGIPSEDVKAYLVEMDKIVLENTRVGKLIGQQKTAYWIGISALLIGGVFTLMLYRGWIAHNNSKYFFYFLVVGGYASIWYSRLLKRKIS
jgi:hypothetical protein